MEPNESWIIRILKIAQILSWYEMVSHQLVRPTLMRRNCIDNVGIRDRRQLGSAVAKGERASEYWKAFCFCVVRSGWRWGGRAIGGLGGGGSPKGVDGGGGGGG